MANTYIHSNDGICQIFFRSNIQKNSLAGEESGEGDIKIDIVLSPLPCGVVKHTPQGRPSPIKGEWEGGPLGSEIFFNGGGEGFSDFFLKVVTVKQAFIFPIGDESHFHQDRGDVRGF